MQHIISIENGVARHPSFRMRSPICLHINKGEQVAVVGCNAAGKSVLVDTVIGRYPLLMNEVNYNFGESDAMVSDNIRYITFRDSYGDSDASFYYQMRWNSQDADETPMVKSLLPECGDEAYRLCLYRLFEIDAMLDKRVVYLSSGELRKFQLAKVLLSHPKVLILDNPFIGLDAQTRRQLVELTEELIAVLHLQVVLVLSKTEDIPAFVTHVIPVDDMCCAQKLTVETYKANQKPLPAHVLTSEKEGGIIALPYKKEEWNANEMVRMHKVNIKYGEHVILKDLDWTVKNGERWALEGQNGSGKSTLLSLICADNPQSYACDIALFGRKRGSGESIWEIKKHIGYVSPEMHRAYLKNLPALDIVASGLHDSVGLYRKTREEDRAICAWWMDIFGILHLKDRSFLQMSSGEQRLVLLARAFVKDPELLILDEPMHGLDAANRLLVQEVIEAFCKREGKALIMVSHYQEELPQCITHHLRLEKNR